MADIAVSASLITVESFISFLRLEVSLPDDVRGGMDNIKGWLNTMRAYLKDTDGADGNEVQKDRIRQVRDLAYDIEDALDEFMLDIPMNRHTHTSTKFIHGVTHYIPNRLALHNMFSIIKTIQGKLDAFLTLEDLRVLYPNQLLSASSSSSSIRNHMVTPDIVEEENEILGLDEDREEIINMLINGSQPRRKILAVVGSGGSGKSALAKMVYNDRRIQSTFDCHAWAHASHPIFIKEDILSSLLMQLPMRRGVRISEEASSLIHILGGKRYLIVLDNIWRKEHWEAIISALPNGLPGSAIIVIARATNVVEFSHVEPPYYIHPMKALPHTIALQLFYKKAFYANNGNCPWELKDLSSQIVQRCEGIPLAIAATGSLLSKKGLPAEWKSLLDSLGAQIRNDSNLSIITKTYVPSYNDLPSHLKSCFLYMGIFPEVKRGRLIRCWIAEGFVRQMTGKTLEETAEDYLNDLIGRSLIQAVSLDFDGRLKTCRTANLVREFIVVKSEENVFLTVFPNQSTSSPRIKGCRRICFLNSCNLDMSQNIDVDRVRSLFTFTTSIDYLPKFHKFKLLKVLDLQESGLNDFPDEIVDLILLRYLSLRSTHIRSVPKSIKRLTYLETLDLKDTRIERLPKEIFRLKKLRHLLVYSYNTASGSAGFNSEIGVEVTSSSIGSLLALQKLSLIKATIPGHFLKQQGSIVVELGKLVNLRKLGLIDLKEEDGEKLCSSIQKMSSLSTLDVKSRTKEEYLDLDNLNVSPPVRLQRLYLKGRLRKLPSWIRSLHSLVRIGLRYSRSTENPLDTLQNLPNLIELEMTDVFLGQELTFIAKKFKKLKRLVIKDFEHLHTMVVQQGGLSTLKSLSIRECQNFKMLPLGINHITKLEELILYDMPEEFIAQLEQNSEDRHMVEHIPTIHSFTLNRHTSGWFFLDLSA